MNLNAKKVKAPSLVLPLLFLAAAGDASLLMAQTAGTFTATGNMTTAHGGGSTATLLTDGTVLIIGGSGENANLSGADLYDPRSGTFTPIGRDDGAARRSHGDLAA